MTDTKSKKSMSNIDFANSQIERFAKKAEEDSNNRAAKFFKESFELYRNEFEREEIIAAAGLAGELIDLRFIGPRVDNGTMPLGQFLEVLDPLNRGLNKAAYRLRNGKEARQIKDDIKDALNLKMSGIGSGSTRILITGDARPDLTGNNLLTDTLTQVFRLLKANNEDFFDAVDAVGGSAAKKFGEALSSTRKHGLEAEFTWKRGKDHLSWYGSPSEIDRIINLIETTQEAEVYEETITGTISAIADTGIIQIRSGEEKIKIRYPMKLIDSAEQLNLNQHVSLKVRTSRFYDAVMQKDVLKRTLIAVI